MSTTTAPKLNKRQREFQEAREMLLKFLHHKSRVYCVLRSVSKSGMSRTIDFYTITEDNRGNGVESYMQYLTGWFGTLLDYRRDKHGALKVGGCGMDMGFHVVYNVGAMLWPKGTDKPHGTRNGEPDNAGGYALKSEWL